MMSENEKEENRDLLAVELSLFTAQAVTIFVVASISSDMLGSEERLSEYVVSKVNGHTLPELGWTLVALVFVTGVITLIKEVVPFGIVERVASQVLFELPRTIYLFGSSIVGTMGATGVFLGTHESSIRPAMGMFVIATLSGFIFFSYGFFLRWMLDRKRRMVSTSAAKASAGDKGNFAADTATGGQNAGQSGVNVVVAQQEAGKAP